MGSGEETEGDKDWDTPRTIGELARGIVEHLEEITGYKAPPPRRIKPPGAEKAGGRGDGFKSIAPAGSWGGNGPAFGLAGWRHRPICEQSVRDALALYGASKNRGAAPPMGGGRPGGAASRRAGDRRTPRRERETVRVDHSSTPSSPKSAYQAKRPDGPITVASSRIVIGRRPVLVRRLDCPHLYIGCHNVAPVALALFWLAFPNRFHLCQPAAHPRRALTNIHAVSIFWFSTNSPSL